MRHFRSLADLGRHFTAVAAKVPTAERRILRLAGGRVSTVIVEQLGHYPSGAMGHWPELAPATQDHRVALGYTANDPLLMSGKLRDSIGVTYGTGRVTIGSPLDYALFHEFGTHKMPPRPVFGPAMRTDRRNNEATIGHEIARIFRGTR